MPPVQPTCLQDCHHGALPVVDALSCQKARGHMHLQAADTRLPSGGPHRKSPT
jgi:hypothetical protein